jgi:hypothetical protein
MKRGIQSNILSTTLLLLSVILNSSCSKENQNARRVIQSGDSESIPIENSKLVNCRFSNPNPSYSFGSTITPNTIICDEGVAKKVEQLTPSPLPSGIQLNSESLSLSGTANERVIQAPYEFYLENEAGYTIIKIQISIQ